MPASEFVRLSKADLDGTPDRRAKLAGMVLDAAPDFYALLPLPRISILDLIGEQLAAADTETEHLRVARRDSSDVALFCCLPAADLERVRREAALAIVRALGKAEKVAFMTALRRYSATVEPLSGGGLYLSRLAVARECRGEGLGAAAVASLLNLAGAEDVLLHVHRQNMGAVSLYRRTGFVPHAGEGFQFTVMIRKTTFASQRLGALS